MRWSVTTVALSGFFVNASTAALCTLNNATPFEQIVGGGGSSSGGGGGGGGFYIPIGHVTGYIKRGLVSDAKPTPVAAPLPPRAADSVQCTSAEVCAVIEDAIFCYNEDTGDFHDTVGTTGNLFTGEYTLADGTSGNLYSDATAGPTGSGAGPATTAAAAAPTRAATTGRAAATAAGAANPRPTANGASSGSSGSAMGGLMALLFAGLF